MVGISHDNYKLAPFHDAIAEGKYLLVVNVASMADYEALAQRLFEGDDNVRRFRTSVALGCLKAGLHVALETTPATPVGRVSAA